MRNKLLHRLTPIPEVIRLYYWSVRLGVRNFAAFFHDYRLIEKSGLFWPSQYLQDAGRRISGHVDPIAHYLAIGSESGMDPNPLFDTSYYLEAYPDVQAANINPLVHYIIFGGAEGRSTHPLFDGEFYARQYAHFLGDDTSPLTDYFDHGTDGTRNPCILFSSRYYLDEYPQVAKSGINPLVHFLHSGSERKFNPHPLFNTKFYGARYFEYLSHTPNPLVEFLNKGSTEGRDPSPLFDTQYYLKANPELRKHDIVPLSHYAEFGIVESRDRWNIYQKWIDYHDSLSENYQKLTTRIQEFEYKPLFSIIMPVYNTDEKWLRRALETVLNQVYPYWELCAADDCSTSPHVRHILEEFRERDSRIRLTFRHETGHISVASNTALRMARGDFIALMDHDDEITENALLENSELLNRHPDADMIYSDEDKINENGLRFKPFFKPDWSPDTFLSQMYCGHFGVYRRSLVEKIGGFRDGFEGSQDYDLVLRLTELTNRIHHIPKVLYHWRTIEGSSASDPQAKQYAYVAGTKSLYEALSRRGETGTVTHNTDHPGQYVVDYQPDRQTMVSIIIPTLKRDDQKKFLDFCLESIRNTTTHDNYEVIVVTGGREAAKASVVKNKTKIRFGKRLKVICSGASKHTSTLINDGVRHSSGEILGFVSDSMVFQDCNWLEKITAQARRRNTGAAGGMILKKNLKIWSAGLILDSVRMALDIHKDFPSSTPGYYARLLIPVNCSAVRSNFLFVKRQLFEERNGFDDSLSPIASNLDFCLWLLDNGYRNVLLSHIRAVQLDSNSVQSKQGSKSEHQFRIDLRVLNHRWGELLERDPYYNPNQTKDSGNYRLDTSFLSQDLQRGMRVWLEDSLVSES